MKNAFLFLSLFFFSSCATVNETPVTPELLDFEVTLNTVNGSSIPGLLGVYCTEEPCMGMPPVDLDLSFYDLSLENQSALTLTFDRPIQEYTLGLLSEEGEALSCVMPSTQISSTQVSLDLCGLLEGPVFLDVSAVYENGEGLTYYFPLTGSPQDETLEDYEVFGVFYHNEGEGGLFVQSAEDEDGYFLRREDLENLALDYASWDGKEIHVQGQAFIHYCSAEEQCLSTGVLRSFSRIDSIELVD